MPPSSRSPAAASASRPARSRARRDMSALRAQRVPDAPGRLDQGWAEAVELLAQVGDVGLEHAGVAAEIVVPHVVEDLAAREHPPRVEQEEPQEPVLRGGQLDRLAAAGDLARLLVELEVLEHEAARIRLGQAGAAQDRADAGDQLL